MDDPEGNDYNTGIIIVIITVLVLFKYSVLLALFILILERLGIHLELPK